MAGHDPLWDRDKQEDEETRRELDRVELKQSFRVIEIVDDVKETARVLTEHYSNGWRCIAIKETITTGGPYVIRTLYFNRLSDPAIDIPF